MEGHNVDDLFDLCLTRDFAVCRVSSYFMLFQIICLRIQVEKPSSSSYCHAPVKTGSILSVYFLKNLEICHVRRPVSRDRRILIMEIEAGKSALHQSCCIFTSNILK